MYVALTRARRRLYLSLAQSRMLHGQTRYNVPSRFLREIPEALVKRMNSGYRRPSAVYAQPASAWKQPDPPVSTLIEASMPWRIGQTVAHPTFGPGVIVSAEGRGPEARVQVNFRDGGLKWLMLDYARLSAA